MDLDNLPLRPLDAPADLEPGELYATHEGEVAVGPVTLKVVQLNDGRRLIDADSMERFWAWMAGGD